MATSENVPRSLLEQILDATFAILEKQGFDLQTLQKLRELSGRGDMTRKNIVEAIREGSEQKQ